MNCIAVYAVVAIIKCTLPLQAMRASLDRVARARYNDLQMTYAEVVH